MMQPSDRMCLASSSADHHTWVKGWPTAKSLPPGAGSSQAYWKNGGVPQTTGRKPPSCRPGTMKVLVRSKQIQPFSKTEGQALAVHRLLLQNCLIHLVQF